MPNARLAMIFCTALFTTAAFGAGTSDVGVGERPAVVTDTGIAAPNSGVSIPVQPMVSVPSHVVLPSDPPPVAAEGSHTHGPECHENSPSPPKICPTNALGIKVCRCP